jgi:hypothetical protein
MGYGGGGSAGAPGTVEREREGETVRDNLWMSGCGARDERVRSAPTARIRVRANWIRGRAVRGFGYVGARKCTPLWSLVRHLASRSRAQVNCSVGKSNMGVQSQGRFLGVPSVG